MRQRHDKKSRNQHIDPTALHQIKNTTIAALVLYRPSSVYTCHRTLRCGGVKTVFL
jgi:hypothetical protein